MPQYRQNKLWCSRIIFIFFIIAYQKRLHRLDKISTERHTAIPSRQIWASSGQNSLLWSVDYSKNGSGEDVLELPRNWWKWHSKIHPFSLILRQFIHFLLFPQIRTEFSKILKTQFCRMVPMAVLKSVRRAVVHNRIFRIQTKPSFWVFRPRKQNSSRPFWRKVLRVGVFLKTWHPTMQCAAGSSVRASILIGRYNYKRNHLHMIHESSL